MYWQYRWAGDLPWGYEMPVMKAGTSSFFHVDPQRNTHDTVRQMFSAFRLRSCICQSDEDLETVRRSLRTIRPELQSDIPRLVDEEYGGIREFQRHMFYWLEAEAFAAHVQPGEPLLMLTHEGKAALRMLDETAPGSNIDTSPLAIARRAEDERIRQMHAGRRWPHERSTLWDGLQFA